MNREETGWLRKASPASGPSPSPPLPRRCQTDGCAAARKTLKAVTESSVVLPQTTAQELSLNSQLMGNCFDLH